MPLTNLQKDALTEILNMHMGVSASLISEIANQKIILSVPVVEIRNGYSPSDTKWAQEAVVTYVVFGQEFSGSASVIFPKDKAAALVNACLDRSPGETFGDFTNDDADVMKEICNIILNSLVGEFGNLLNIRLEYSHFDFSFTLDSLEKMKLIPSDYTVLELYTTFFLTKSRVKGIILLALSASSFDMLIHKIDEMLVELNA